MTGWHGRPNKALFNKWSWKNVILMGKMKLNHCLTLYTKINSRYRDLIIKGKTLKVLGENIRKFLSDLV